jgi:hypothetical protein
MAEDNTQSTVAEFSGRWWANELQVVEKELDQRWRLAADKIVKRYLDERADSDQLGGEQRRYNIFWANTQILKSALYATPPKPMVTRQYGDSKDDVARTAALMLQRLLTFDVTADGSSSHKAFSQGVEDRLIPGMGQVWIRYDVETEKFPIPAIKHPLTGEELSPASEGERIVQEEAPIEYVQWRDFLWSPARVWSEVWWVARRIWMKRKKFIKMFGNDVYKQIKENAARQPGHDILPKGFEKGRVEVFEIWCEDTNRVYWVNRHLDECLKDQEDPLKLDEFFPCPEPLLGTHTTNTLIPRADYTMVQDQYEELDTLNDRINTLTKALRVVGVYDKEQTELKQMVTGAEFNLIAVENWAMLAEKGGLKGCVDWFPIEQVAAVLEKLVAQRMLVVQEIYELTSISDIMRGSSNPRETLGAQKLKAQYSSVRLQLTQQDVGQWAQHAMRIRAEVMCKHFQPKTLIEYSQIVMTDSAPFAEQAVQLLKNYRQAEYRISINEQTLSMADYNAERDMRIEYVTAFGQFMSQVGAIAATMPMAIPYMLRILQWVTASFRGSQDVESVLDEAIAAAQQMPPTPPGQEGQTQQPPEDKRPEMMAKMQDTQAKVQTAREQMQTQVQIANMNNQAKITIEEMKQQGNQLAQAQDAMQDAATREHEMGMAAQDQAHAAQMTQQDHEFNEQQSNEDRRFQASQNKQQSKE